MKSARTLRCLNTSISAAQKASSCSLVTVGKGAQKKATRRKKVHNGVYTLRLAGQS